MEIVKVDSVFTTRRFDPLAFVKRPIVYETVLSALEIPGTQLVISGPIGSGKTTLLNTCARQLGIQFVTVNCEPYHTMDLIVENVITQLGVSIKEHEEHSQNESFIEKVGLGWLGAQNVTGSHSKQVFRTTNPTQPSFHWLAHQLVQRNKMLVIDDFHKLEAEVQMDLFGKIKVYLNISNEYPAGQSRIVLMGAAKTSGHPLFANPDLRNRITSVELELMTDSEIESIITLGEGLLNIQIPDASKKQIIQLSCGVPSICHILCLNLCKMAGIKETQLNRVTVNGDSLKKAIEFHRTVSLHSFKEMYELATVRKRVRKYDNAKIILNAIASLDLNQVTQDQILAAIRSRVPEYPLSNLTLYLRELTEETRGAVLRMDPNTRKYSFVDPFFKSFIRSQQ